MRTKQQYLEAMGIDVWVRRELLARRALAAVRLFQSAATGGEALAGVEVGAAASAAAVVDVDVKVNAAGAKSDAAKSGLASAESSAQSASQTALAEAPQFKLAFIRYGDLGMCLNLNSNLQGKVPKNFCDDLARALGADIKEAKIINLEWPVAKIATMDQSLETARRAVAEKMTLLPSLALVFGEDIKEYYPPLAAAAPDGEVTANGQRLLLLPAAEAALTSANIKREVWQRLCRLRVKA